MNGSTLNTIPLNGSPSNSSSSGSTTVLGGPINSVPINTLGINGGLTSTSGGILESLFEVMYVNDTLVTTEYENIVNTISLKGYTIGFNNLYQESLIDIYYMRDVLNNLIELFLKEGILIGSTLNSDVIYGILETIHINSYITTKSTINELVKDSVNISDLLLGILILVIADSLGISHSDFITKVVLDKLQESIKNSSSFSSTVNTLESLIANFSIATLLYTGYNNTTIENITLNETAVSILSSLDTILENLTILLSTSNSIILLSSIKEELETNDTLNSIANLSSLLLENIEMIAIDHGGETYSGWVLSPETFAIWRYSNYDFNSIAILNRKTFLANSTGLFSMEGSLDEGSFIQSRLKTASLDFGTTNLKVVPEMYVGMNTDGEMVIAVTTDERLKVKYKLVNPSEVQELKYVKIGKGIRGSIWQFELIDDKSTQTDISHIEWLPVVFGRKRR